MIDAIVDVGVTRRESPRAVSWRVGVDEPQSTSSTRPSRSGVSWESWPPSRLRPDDGIVPGWIGI